MNMDQEITLSWEGHHKMMISIFEKLLESSSLVDCTVVAEGRKRKVHKEVLLAFSQYFQILLDDEDEKNPTIILSGFTFQELSALIDYMYYGKIVVPSDKVENLIAAAQCLQIRGLRGTQEIDSSETINEEIIACPRPGNSSRIARKRRRINESEKLSMGRSVGNKTRTRRVPRTLPTEENSSLTIKRLGTGDGSTESLSSDVISGPSRSNLSLTENAFVWIPKCEVDVCDSNSVTLESIGCDAAIADLSADINMSNDNNTNESVPLKQNVPQLPNLPPAISVSTVVTPVHSEIILASSSNEQDRNTIIPSGDLLAPSTATDERSSELALKVEPVDEYRSEETGKDAADVEVLGEMERDEQEPCHAASASQATPADTEQTPSAPRSERRQRCHPQRGHIGGEHTTGEDFADTEVEREQRRQEGSESPKTSISDDAHSTKESSAATLPTSDPDPPYKRNRGKRHACPYCKKVFSFPSCIKRHVKIHTGERPFKCSECDYATIHASRLAIHLRRHTGEKPYKCPECVYACADKNDLAIHRRRHSGKKTIKCPECDYTCVGATDLASHRKRHSEKRYKCSECKYATAYASALVTHRRRHAGEKPYKCSECNYACCSASNLAQHRRRHKANRTF